MFLYVDKLIVSNSSLSAVYKILCSCMITVISPNPAERNEIHRLMTSVEAILVCHIVSSPTCGMSGTLVYYNLLYSCIGWRI